MNRCRFCDEAMEKPMCLSMMNAFPSQDEVSGVIESVIEGAEPDSEKIGSEDLESEMAEHVSEDAEDVTELAVEDPEPKKSVSVKSDAVSGDRQPTGRQRSWATLTVCIVPLFTPHCRTTMPSARAAISLSRSVK